VTGAGAGAGHPRVLALVDRATVAAVAGALEAGATTVGVRVEPDHLHRQPGRANLEVDAVLERIAGRRLE
jgi:fluoroacetyl-CoA thioesterase